MKTEYLVECYERPGMDDFFLIVSLKNKNKYKKKTRRNNRR